MFYYRTDLLQKYGLDVPQTWDDVQHAAAMQFSRLITYDALYYKGTDAASYYDAYGDIVGGIGSYPVLGSPHYHQASDRLEFENHQLIAETSKTTIATVMLMASSPSRLTHLKVEGPGSVPSTIVVSWTPSPEKDEFQRIRKKWDPELKFRSAQSIRLLGDPT